MPGGSFNAAEGYVATFVGGTQTIDHDERTDDLPGRLVRGDPRAEWLVPTGRESSLALDINSQNQLGGIPVLTVRKPRFDFTDSVPHWGDNVEAVTIFNSGAIIPTPIERYLIRVMRMAKQQLDPVIDAELIEIIELFNKQEGQHHKLHNDLMAMLTAKAYPRLREFEAAFDADLKEFLATKSLAWNLAYCEGFESTGCALAEAWIDGGIKEICGDHGSIPMQLWMWHMAEEFEHRSVVHDVLHRIYGTEKAFELRKQGAAINRQHNAEHALAAAVYITEIDQAP